MHGVDEANSGMWFMRILIGKTGENPDCTYSPIDGSPSGGWSPNKKLRIDNFRIARDTPKIPLPVPVLSVIAVLNNWQDSIERSFAG